MTPGTSHLFRLSLIVLAAALVPAASAQPPDGFRESWRLTPHAAKIAVVPRARVYCATSRSAWLAQLESQGSTPSTIGFAYPKEDEVFLSPPVCRTLENWLRGRKVQTRTFALHLFALTHESMHVRGIRSEHRADCAALKRYPFAAGQFGIRKPARVAELRRTLSGRTWCS